MKVHHFNTTSGAEIETPVPAARPHFNTSECDIHYGEENDLVEIVVVYEDDIYYVFKTGETKIDICEALGIQTTKAKCYSVEDANGRVLDAETGIDTINGAPSEEYRITDDELYTYLSENLAATYSSEAINK